MVTNFPKFGYIPEIPEYDVPVAAGNNQKLKRNWSNGKPPPPVSCPPVIRLPPMQTVFGLIAHVCVGG